jgi:TPP-dependent pyruvate/acetoin dehydrogenase alpha subunit
MTLSVDKALWMLRTMWRIRLFEEKCAELYTLGRLPGFLHSAIGQEAVSAGACAVLRDDDYITSTHRGHADVIAKGARLDRMMAELFGKATGYCRAKGGSMHIADFSLGILGANGIVGAGVPLAGGAALSAKMRGTDQVCVCFFGDGAMSTGAFHEGVTLSLAWDLPVVYVCANNGYALSTACTTFYRSQTVAGRVAGLKLPAVTIDGNDATAVYTAVGEAVGQARTGKGPCFVECLTYRWLGHYVGDPATYRPREEVEERKSRDPIPRFESYLRANGLASDADVAAIQAESRQEVNDAVAYAETSPEPDLASAHEDVFAERGLP